MKTLLGGLTVLEKKTKEKTVGIELWGRWGKRRRKKGAVGEWDEWRGLRGMESTGGKGA